jgi:glycosyltransferase involved in cell wall biosynthesis
VFEHYPLKVRTTKHDNLRIIFVGGVIKTKGAYDIVDLAASMPDLKFQLVGHIHKRPGTKLDKLPINIELTGSKSNKEVIDILSTGDIFLFPSYSEGFPVAVLEAMAMGLPVIASRVGAIPEMVDQDQGGYLVNPGDITEIKDSLRKLADNPNRRMKFGNYNRNKCQSLYSYANVSNALVDIYNEVI